MSEVVIGFALGNSIIGKVVSEDDRSIVLENPLEIMTLPVENRVQVSLIPLKFIFNESKSKRVKLSKSQILFINNLDDFPSLKEGYETELKKLSVNTTQEKPQIIT